MSNLLFSFNTHGTRFLNLFVASLTHVMLNLKYLHLDAKFSQLQDTQHDDIGNVHQTDIRDITGTSGKTSVLGSDQKKGKNVEEKLLASICSYLHLMLLAFYLLKLGEAHCLSNLPNVLQFHLAWCCLSIAKVPLSLELYRYSIRVNALQDLHNHYYICHNNHYTLQVFSHGSL